MPSCDVTWLHISDAHFGALDMTGALDSVIAMLLDDLQRMRSERSLVPDFLFFTGDIAFGELPHSQLADHASIPRQLAEGQIRLRPMSVDELIDLISNEEARSQNAFAFSAQAKRDVASAARGMPFFAHFLGRYSLEAASRDNTNERSVKVELSHVQRALSERLTDLGDLEGEYVRVVNGRWEREVLLKLLSSRDEDSIPLINLRAAAAQLGVRRLDSAVQSFVKNGVMNRVAEAMYQFNDTRLMVYARLRAPLTDEARKRWCHHESTRIAAS